MRLKYDTFHHGGTERNSIRRNISCSAIETIVNSKYLRIPKKETLYYSLIFFFQFRNLEVTSYEIDFSMAHGLWTEKYCARNILYTIGRLVYIYKKKNCYI